MCRIKDSINSAESLAAEILRSRRRTINKPAFALEKGQKRFFFHFFPNKNKIPFNISVLQIKIFFVFLSFRRGFFTAYAQRPMFRPITVPVFSLASHPAKYLFWAISDRSSPLPAASFLPALFLPRQIQARIREKRNWFLKSDGSMLLRSMPPRFCL